MASEEPTAERISLPLVWRNVGETPLLFANQFIGLTREGDMFLLLGVVAPPILLGDPSEVRAQVQDLTQVEVQCIARVALTRGRMEELIDILGRTLDSDARERELRAQQDQEAEA